MKFSKFLVAALMTISVSAFAGEAKPFIGFEYATEKNRNTDAEDQKAAAVLGYKVDDVAYSMKLATSQAEWGNGSISSEIELRAKKSFSGMGSMKPYIGVRLGEKLKSSYTFTYAAVDFGVKIPLFGGFTTDIGGRYRDNFDSANDYRSTRGHVVLAYNITKHDEVGVRYSQAYGDSGEEKNAWRLHYTKGF